MLRARYMLSAAFSALRTVACLTTLRLCQGIMPRMPRVEAPPLTLT
jgi:hypothetical protein